MRVIQNIIQMLGQIQWYHLWEKHIRCREGQRPWTELMCSLECDVLGWCMPKGHTSGSHPRAAARFCHCCKIVDLGINNLD